jgi:DNA-binding transcriptional MerR regulator
MFSIGEFARHGGVSVRMLRHYDAIGLLRPARVDAATGYRFYSAEQLARLNRVVALKELGFTLEQVHELVDADIGVEQLHGMLTLRRSQLQAQITADAARLAHVEARLRMIESESRMPEQKIVLSDVPAMRLAELSAVAAGFEPEHIGPVIQPLCAELGRLLENSTLTSPGPLIAYYEDAPGDDGAIVVHAGVPVSADVGEQHGLTVVDLPAIAAATVVHRGKMDDVVPTAQALARWIEANGYQSAGYPREVYLETDAGDQSGWVTELQEPVVRS